MLGAGWVPEGTCFFQRELAAGGDSQKKLIRGCLLKFIVLARVVLEETHVQAFCFGSFWEKGGARTWYVSHTRGLHGWRLCLMLQLTDTSHVIHKHRLLGQAASQLCLSWQPFAVMGKVRRASRGKLCLGVFGSKNKCDRSLDRSGLPIVLCKNCVHCGEQRCRQHCRCGRKKTAKAKGRAAPRRRREPAAPSVAPVASRAPVLPVLRARVSGSSVEDVDVDAWYRQLCADIKGCSSVELATYVYDDAAVQAVLLKRLQGQTNFKLNMYIDAERFAGEVPRFQKCRLRALHAAGAQIYISKGIKPLGSFHAKAVVIGSGVLYTGSANLTQKSRSNEEFCYRMVGPVAQRMLDRLAGVRRRGKLWDGS